MRRWLSICLVLAAFAGGAQAAGIRNLRDGWLLSAGESILLLECAPGEPDRPRVPGSGWWAAAGQAHLHGLPELPLHRWAVGGPVPATGRRLSWEAGWETLGAGLVRERRGQVRLQLGNARRVGLVWSRADLAIDDVEEARHCGLGLYAGRDWREAGGLWRLELRAPLDAGPVWLGPAGRRPFVRAVALRTGPALAAAIGLSRRGDGSFAAGAEVQLALGDRLVVGWRADPATGALGPSTVWRIGALLIRTSHLVHPELAATHRCELVVGRPAAAGP